MLISWFALKIKSSRSTTMRMRRFSPRYKAFTISYPWKTTWRRTGSCRCKTCETVQWITDFWCSSATQAHAIRKKCLWSLTLATTSFKWTPWLRARLSPGSRSRMSKSKKILHAPLKAWGVFLSWAGWAAGPSNKRRRLQRESSSTCQNRGSWKSSI